MFKNYRLKCKTDIKLLEQNMEESLCDLGLDKDFSVMIPKV